MPVGFSRLVERVVSRWVLVAAARGSVGRCAIGFGIDLRYLAICSHASRWGGHLNRGFVCGVSKSGATK